MNSPPQATAAGRSEGGRRLGSGPGSLAQTGGRPAGQAKKGEGRAGSRRPTTQVGPRQVAPGQSGPRHSRRTRASPAVGTSDGSPGSRFRDRASGVTFPGSPRRLARRPPDPRVAAGIPLRCLHYSVFLMRFSIRNQQAPEKARRRASDLGISLGRARDVGHGGESAAAGGTATSREPLRSTRETSCQRRGSVAPCPSARPGQLGPASQRRPASSARGRTSQGAKRHR